MQASIVETRVRTRPRAIEVIDPEGVMFPELAVATRSELGAGTGFVVGRRGAHGGAADLLLCVLDARRDWGLVERLCAAGPTLVAVPGLTRVDSLQAIELGAHGCLDVAVSREALGGAIRGILAGEVAFSRVAMGAWLRRQVAVEAPNAPGRLTARQREILALIAEGCSDTEIAGRLAISPGTASKHVSNILERLGAPNRAAAVGMMSGRRPASIVALHGDVARRQRDPRRGRPRARPREDPSTVDQLAS